MTTLSERISALRREKNEPQTSLADALGISNRTVSKWENAESEPDAASLSALADHFGVSVDDLLGRAPTVPDPYEEAETYTDAALIYHRENYRTLRALEEACHRIFELHFNQKDAYRDVKQDAAPVPPPFPFADDGIPWSNNAYSHVTSSCLFSQLCAGREVNMSVALFPNESNYAWLADRAEEIAASLRAFADARVLRLLVKMHAPDFPEKFTLEYAAEEAGMPAEELAPALDLLFDFGADEIELEEGSAKLYSWWNGAPRLLAALSLIYLEYAARETGTNLHNGSFRPIVKKEEKE